MTAPQWPIITGRVPTAADAQHDKHGCVLVYDYGYWHFMRWDKAAYFGITTFMPLPPAPDDAASQCATPAPAEHVYSGLCPDRSQPGSRDPDCPACVGMMK